MLKISDLHAGYGKIQILSGVNLEAEPDRITAVLGGNGTGKSTLLKAVSGLIRPWQGTIEFDGERIDGMRPDKIVRLGLSQVTQGKEVYPAMSVEENIRVGAFVHTDRRKIAEDLRTRLRLLSCPEGTPQIPCRHLERRSAPDAVHWARALMARPRMIMLDEPSSALAPRVILDIFHTLDKIRRDGTTILLVEQNVRMGLLLAHFGYVIKDGVVHMQGEADSLMKDDNVRLSYLGGTLASAEGAAL